MSTDESDSGVSSVHLKSSRTVKADPVSVIKVIKIYDFTVFIRFLSIWEVYHTHIGLISKYGAKQLKIVRSTGTFMVASLNMPLLFYGFTVVNPFGYYLICVCPQNTKPSN